MDTDMPASLAQNHGPTLLHYFEPLVEPQPSLYLAGPTWVPEGETIWHDEAVEYLRRRKFAGSVCLPTPADGVWGDDEDEADEQSDWQDAMLARVTCIMVWLPYPGPMTMFEIGHWLLSGRMVVGSPPDAPRVHDVLRRVQRANVPLAHTLEETVDLALGLMNSQ